jgi:hypothetical protein
LTDEGHRTAIGALRSCFDRCTTVRVADRLVDRAADLAADLHLRAADAIHLATALAVVEADSLFVTWDRRLRLGSRPRRACFCACSILTRNRARRLVAPQLRQAGHRIVGTSSAPRDTILSTRSVDTNITN